MTFVRTICLTQNPPLPRIRVRPYSLLKFYFLHSLKPLEVLAVVYRDATYIAIMCHIKFSLSKPTVTSFLETYFNPLRFWQLVKHFEGLST